jgi:LruC domain-containing protein
MKRIIALFTLLLALGILFQGCRKSDTPEESKTMDNMIVPEGFVFETTRDVEMTIQMPNTVDFSDLRSRFDVYTERPDNGGKLITSGSFNEQGKFTGNLRIPITLNEITVMTIAGAVTVEVPEFTTKEGGVIIDFGDDYGNNPPDTTEPTFKSKMENPVIDESRGFTSQNLIGNGDFSSSDMGSMQYWSSTIPADQRWYITQYTGAGQRYNDDGNWVFRTPLTEPGNYYYGGVAQRIDASAGDVISFSADIKSVGNNNRLYSRLYIIPRNSNGNSLAYYNVRYDYPSSNWKRKTITATMPQGTAYVTILVWLNDYKANSSIYIDNVVVTGPVTDSDNDGVDDDIDDYPNDGTRAFNVYYPNSTDWGTFAFEDLWPGKGDYDFNDLILDYQFKSVINSSNELVEFYTDYSVRAIGASLINGFAFMISGDPTNVASVTGTSITQDYLNLNANGTEQNQTNTVVFLFDNAFSMIGSSGSTFINTKEDVSYVDPDTNQLHVLFNNAVVNAGTAPYNPFIVVDEIRGQEVHLAGEAPTDLMDTSLFGTWADDSNPAAGKYYQTINNLPWALDLPVKFEYPVEQVQIIDAYNHFQEWGESGGSLYNDWYENKSGYRNSSNIYTIPE